MSIPIQFAFYNEEGDLLDIRSIFTINYGSNPADLTEINKRMKESNTFAADTRLFIHKDIKYIVPTMCQDYMFDLDTLALLPNKFK